VHDDSDCDSSGDNCRDLSVPPRRDDDASSLSLIAAVQFDAPRRVILGIRDAATTSFAAAAAVSQLSSPEDRRRRRSDSVTPVSRADVDPALSRIFK